MIIYLKEVNLGMLFIGKHLGGKAQRWSEFPQWLIMLKTFVFVIIRIFKRQGPQIRMENVKL